MSVSTATGSRRTALQNAWSAERAEARDARSRGDFASEWAHLERAHILSQPMAVRHVRTHVAMLRYGLRRHDRHEVVGQLFRMVVAGPGSVAGRYPVGNTGGADVRAMAVMPIPDDLRVVLESGPVRGAPTAHLTTSAHRN